MKIGKKATITLTGIVGEVVGEYRHKVFPMQLLVRYAATDGEVKEQWFTADELTAVPAPAKSRAKAKR